MKGVGWAPRPARTACLLSAALIFLTMLYITRAELGELSFPLDDAWIHLQFARNLAEWGRFSYYQDQMVTAGSSSPLYTFLLALLFRVCPNEFAISHGLGFLCLLLSGLVVLRLFEDKPGAPWGPPLLLWLAYLIEPRLLWAAASGMETTLFLLVLLATLWARQQGNYLATGLGLGLAPWVRPEGILLTPVVLGGYALSGSMRPNLRRILPAAAVTAGAWLAYAGLNLWLSGSVVPNTIRAKRAYYGGGGARMAWDILDYLCAGHLGPLCLLAFLGLLHQARRAYRKDRVDWTPALWLGTLIGFLLMTIPFLYQEGRYCITAIPCLFLLAREGLSAFAADSRWPTLAALTILGAALSAEPRLLRDYPDRCAYFLDRHVKTARWIDSHLPPNATVATHDVGALAYYGKRRIFDVLGLITPEAIPYLHDRAGLDRLMQADGVSHVAAFDNWLVVDNEPILFETDVIHPEVMRVFAYHPGHLLDDSLKAVLDYALTVAAQQGPRPALTFLAGFQKQGWQSSTYWALVGSLQRRVPDAVAARDSLAYALQLNPSSTTANLEMAALEAQQGNREAALKRLHQVLQRQSGQPIALRLYLDILRAPP